MNRRKFLLAAGAGAALGRAADTKVLLPSDEPDAAGFRLMWYSPVPPLDPQSWRLKIGGLVESPAALSLGDLRKLPQEKQSSRLKCVQCWSARTERGGVRFHDVVVAPRTPQRPNYPAKARPAYHENGPLLCRKSSKRVQGGEPALLYRYIRESEALVHGPQLAAVTWRELALLNAAIDVHVIALLD